MRRRLRLNVLFGLMLLSAGCLNYTSIIEINPDGSGTLLMELRVPLIEEDTLHEIEEVWEGADSVEGWLTTIHYVDTIDSVIIKHLEGSFDSPQALSNVLDMDSGNFEFTMEESDSFCYYHLYKYYEPAGDDEFEMMLELLEIDTIPDSLKDYTWEERIIIHGTVTESNADTAAGDTLIWHRLVWDMYRDGLTIMAFWEARKETNP